MKRKEEKKSGLVKSQTIMNIIRQSRQQDMMKGDSQRKQETSCLVHLFSPFSQQLSLTVLSCGLYQLPTKACHNMKLVVWKYYEKVTEILFKFLLHYLKVSNRFHAQTQNEKINRLNILKPVSLFFLKLAGLIKINRSQIKFRI